MLLYILIAISNITRAYYFQKRNSIQSKDKIYGKKNKIVDLPITLGAQYIIQFINSVSSNISGVYHMNTCIVVIHLLLLL